MDIEKLIHCLQCCSKVDAHNIGCDDCGLEYCGPECQQLCGTAATALSTLQGENEKLRAELDEKEKYYDQMIDALSATDSAELEQVKRERDAAVKCIEEIEDALNFQRISAIGLRISEWRGQKED